MLLIFIRDCTPALNSLIKTPSAVCICEPRCHEDELGSPCRPLHSTDEDPALSQGSDAGVHVSRRGHRWGRQLLPAGAILRQRPRWRLWFVWNFVPAGWFRFFFFLLGLFSRTLSFSLWVYLSSDITHYFISLTKP